MAQELKRWDELLIRLDPVARTTVVEVGVWRGKMSKVLLSRTKFMVLHMVDRWEAPPDGDSYASSGSEIAAGLKGSFDQAFHESVNIAQAYPKRAHVIKEDSVAAAARFEDGSVDIVFIDGDHSYNGCHRDVVAWLPKVRKGGWIGGHDYAHPKQGEVKRAVDELFAGKKIVLGGNRSWWVKI